MQAAQKFVLRRVGGKGVTGLCHLCHLHVCYLPSWAEPLMDAAVLLMLCRSAMPHLRELTMIKDRCVHVHACMHAPCPHGLTPSYQ